MPEHDTHRLVDAQDLPAALGLLTRLPVRVDFARAQARGARAAWAWPIAGALVGTVAGLVGLLAAWLGLPPAFTAGLVILCQVMMTGAMHEDGLADTADGLWGGYTRDRRLEIMKDSAIGAYGTIALVLSLLLRAAALAPLFAVSPTAACAALVLAGALGRAAMGALMGALPNARGSGLSDSVGRPEWATVALGLAIAVAISLMASLWALSLASLAAAFCATAATSMTLAMLAKAKIGGQTGDILGANAILAEIATLGACAALLI